MGRLGHWLYMFTCGYDAHEEGASEGYLRKLGSWGPRLKVDNLLGRDGRSWARRPQTAVTYNKLVLRFSSRVSVFGNLSWECLKSDKAMCTSAELSYQPPSTQHNQEFKAVLGYIARPAWATWNSALKKKKRGKDNVSMVLDTFASGKNILLLGKMGGEYCPHTAEAAGGVFFPSGIEA